MNVSTTTPQRLILDNNEQFFEEELKTLSPSPNVRSENMAQNNSHIVEETRSDNLNPKTSTTNDDDIYFISKFVDATRINNPQDTEIRVHPSQLH